MNGNPSVQVDAAIELRLLVPQQPSLPLPVSLLYGSRDPYAVTVRFHGAEEHVEWVFARELLVAGLSCENGLGDVRVRPARDADVGDVVIISLASPDGSAELEADADDLRTFLLRTEQVVPLGGEHRFVDVEAELAEMFAN